MGMLSAIDLPPHERLADAYGHPLAFAVVVGAYAGRRDSAHRARARGTQRGEDPVPEKAWDGAMTQRVTIR